MYTLEDVHADTAPSSEAGDHSDVVAKTPFGKSLGSICLY
jgi:hypothetical protein